MSHFLQATLLQEIFHKTPMGPASHPSHGNVESSVTAPRTSLPAAALQLIAERKHPWGGDQAVACYENRAAEGIKVCFVPCVFEVVIYSAWAGEISASLAAGSPSPLRN